MKILNSSFSIVFPPFFNVREQIFELERGLSEKFASPFTLVPVPNEAPPEIPRITALTKNGHSTLSITLNSVQFTTNYDDQFSGDIDKCMNYVRDYFNRIYEALYPRYIATIQFVGLIVNVQHQLEPGNDATLVLRQRFLKLLTESKLHDALIKYTFNKEDTYYINLQVQNQRLAVNQIFPGFLGQSERKDLFMITLDVNDRFGLNYQQGYTSDAGKMEKILELTHQYLDSGIPDLLENGRFDV